MADLFGTAPKFIPDSKVVESSKPDPIPKKYKSRPKLTPDQIRADRQQEYNRETMRIYQRCKAALENRLNSDAPDVMVYLLNYELTSKNGYVKKVARYSNDEKKQARQNPIYRYLFIESEITKLKNLNEIAAQQGLKVIQEEKIENIPLAEIYRSFEKKFTIWREIRNVLLQTFSTIAEKSPVNIVKKKNIWALIEFEKMVCKANNVNIQEVEKIESSRKTKKYQDAFLRFVVFQIMILRTFLENLSPELVQAKKMLDRIQKKIDEIDIAFAGNKTMIEILKIESDFVEAFPNLKTRQDWHKEYPTIPYFSPDNNRPFNLRFARNEAEDHLVRICLQLVGQKAALSNQKNPLEKIVFSSAFGQEFAQDRQIEALVDQMSSNTGTTTNDPTSSNLFDYALNPKNTDLNEIYKKRTVFEVGDEREEEGVISIVSFKPCKVCKKPTKNRCTLCEGRQFPYCCNDCQTKDWENHREECEKVRQIPWMNLDIVCIVPNCWKPTSPENRVHCDICNADDIIYCSKECRAHDYPRHKMECSSE
jgi:hypothetical protein